MYIDDVRNALRFVSHRLGLTAIFGVIHALCRAQDEFGTLFFSWTSSLIGEQVWMHLRGVCWMTKLCVRCDALGVT